MLLLEKWSEQVNIDELGHSRQFSGISWQQYEDLLEKLGDSLRYRVSYLDGVLEIMAPGRWHETRKTRIGTLLEMYFFHHAIPYFPTGSTTFKNPLKQVGLEPDESYCFFTDKPIPDLAIEVIVTSGNLKRLELYQRLGVAEVWFYQKSKFTVYSLDTDSDGENSTFGYQLQETSSFLTNLDFNRLEIALENPNPLEAAQEFQKYLQG